MSKSSTMMIVKSGRVKPTVEFGWFASESQLSLLLPMIMHLFFCHFKFVLKNP